MCRTKWVREEILRLTVEQYYKPQRLNSSKQRAKQEPAWRGSLRIAPPASAAKHAPSTRPAAPLHCRSAEPGRYVLRPAGGAHSAAAAQRRCWSSTAAPGAHPRARPSGRAPWLDLATSRHQAWMQVMERPCVVMRRQARGPPHLYPHLSGGDLLFKSYHCHHHITSPSFE